MLLLHQLLAMMLLGEIPQGSAGTSVGTAGPPQAAGVGSIPGTPQGAPGVPASGPGVPAPSAVPAPPGLIQSAELYQLDPNDPNTRLTGHQLAQGFQRARQYDAIQGNFQRQTSELEAERQARQTAEQRLQDYEERDRMANYVRELGIGAPVAATQPPVQSGQPGVPPGAGAADDFLLSFGDVTPNPGTPPGGIPPGAGDQPGGPGGTNSNPLLDDPRRLVSVFNTLMSDGNKKLLDELRSSLPDMVESSVSRRFDRQARQDRVQNTFSSARSQLSEDMLNDYGIPEERSRDILDKLTLVLASNAEASRLLTGEYESPEAAAQARETADAHMAQSNELFSSMLKGALESGFKAREDRQQVEAQEMLETGSYAESILGNELQQAPTDVYDPAAIEKILALNNQKAVELAETQSRLQNTVGGSVRLAGT